MLAGPMVPAIIHALFLVYTLMLFARILGSWVPQLSQYRLMQMVGFYTDPYLRLFRKVIPPLGIIDLSPLAAFFVLQLLEHLAVMFFR